MVDQAAELEADARVDAESGGFGSLGSIIGALVAFWAVTIAAPPLRDNSFLTHLATGRLILDRGSVPSSDPYTFTAQGTDWTVQSWLASVAYAGAERIAGGTGLRVLVLVTFVAAGVLLWRLSRPAGSLVPRIFVVAIAMFVVTDVWTERPYMVGVIGLGLVVLALDGAIRPWLLVPVMWVWANAHGSFPLAIVLTLAVLAGSAVDRRMGRGAEDELTHGRRVLGYVVLGTLLAVIGPLGPSLLLFPFEALGRSDLLSEIVEWQAPAFESGSERMFLVLVFVTMAGLVRTGRWRHAIPAFLFAAAGILAQRNLVMAVMVLVPIAASCMPRVGELTSRTVPALGRVFTAVLCAVVLFSSVVVAGNDAITLAPYPERALAWLQPTDAGSAGSRLATQDYVGNLLELLDGPSGRVFIDDRADMFPAEVFADATALLDGEPQWSEILDRHRIQVVLWRRDHVVASLLAADPAWQTVYSDSRWMVACRRSQGCGTVER